MYITYNITYIIIYVYIIMYVYVYIYIYMFTTDLSTATGFRNNPTAEKKTPVLILKYPRNIPGLFPQAACDTVTNKHRPKACQSLLYLLVGGIPAIGWQCTVDG